MHFSFSLLKKLAPFIKNKKDLVEKLNLYSFETADLGGDILDIALPPNRFSDAASHWGMAKEISAIFGVKHKNTIIFNAKAVIDKDIKVSVKTPFCNRMTTRYFEGVKIGSSPKWMQEILISCSMRPINNLVDITNFVMLETGQPTHAFDFDKMDGSTLFVRNANNKEKVQLLNGGTTILNSKMIVLADNKNALDVAGIKGGKKAEIIASTKNLLLTSGSFNGVSIYKTSKEIKLSTEASVRFSHNISPELAGWGLLRASELIEELCKGKKGRVIDVYPKKPLQKIIKFEVRKFNKLIGSDFDLKTARKYLERVGFNIKKIDSAKQILWLESPFLRQDIEYFEDAAEEVTRLYGYNKVKIIAPHISLQPAELVQQIIVKDKIRQILIGAGYNEVYNYSFIAEEDGKKLTSVNQFTPTPNFGVGAGQRQPALIEIDNPISKESYYLRPSLAVGFLKNISDNLKFMDKISIFEIGKIFYRDPNTRMHPQLKADPPQAENNSNVCERLTLGIALADKNKKTFFELKGIMEELLKKLRIIKYSITEPENKNTDWGRDFTKKLIDENSLLKIASGNKVFGYLGKLKKDLSKGTASILEIDLDVLSKFIDRKRQYQALFKYPSSSRDISILVNHRIKIGEIIEVIKKIGKYIIDIDLVDEYVNEKLGKNLKSLAFRIIFRAETHTLIDKTISKEMEKIVAVLKNKFKAQMR